jgi:hypothetical protein
MIVETKDRTVVVTVSPEEIRTLCSTVPGFALQIHSYEFEFDGETGMLGGSTCSNQEQDSEDWEEDEDEDECVSILAEVVADFAKPFCIVEETTPDRRYQEVQKVLVALQTGR